MNPEDDKSDTKGRILYDFIYMSYLEQSNSQRQKIEWWLPGAREGGIRSYCLMGTEFQSGKMKKFWRWMTGIVAQQRKVLNATESYT